MDGDLLNLDGNNAVLFSTVEELHGGTVTGGLDVLFLGTGLHEKVNNCLGTLLGQVLVALGGTGLFVGVTVDGQLGVFIHDVAGEVLEVSLSRAEILVEPQSK